LSLILAIDPGPTKSAYVFLDHRLMPKSFGIEKNEDVLHIIKKHYAEHFAIEMIASYGMAVGKEVFETCVWIGRLSEASNINPTYIYRKDEKINLCGSMKAKDGNIRQALIDRFGPVGVKKNQGWFYGVSKDVWAAVATGVTYHDLYLVNEKGETL
jgi:hypothetical protein